MHVFNTKCIIVNSFLPLHALVNLPHISTPVWTRHIRLEFQLSDSTSVKYVTDETTTAPNAPINH